jgi:hypothetical protein
MYYYFFSAQILGLETSPPYLSLSSKSNNTSVFLTGVSFASGGAGVLNTTNSVRISFHPEIEVLVFQFTPVKDAFYIFHQNLVINID